MANQTAVSPAKTACLSIAIYATAICLAMLVSESALAQAKPSTMSGMEMSKPVAVPSTNLTLTIGGKAITFSVAQLKTLPQKSVSVHNEHTKADETYSGVSLSEVLAKAGLVIDKTTEHKLLHSYLRIEGTDKYWVIYSLIEVEASEHNGDVIVAIAVDGHSLGTDGELKLIATEDKKPQRWVRNLSAITLVATE